MVLLLYVLEEEGESPCPVLYAGFPEEGAFAIFVGGGVDGHAVQLVGRKILSCQSFFMDMQRYEIRLRFPKPKAPPIVFVRARDASRVSESNCIFPLKNNKKLYSSGRIS